MLIYTLWKKNEPYKEVEPNTDSSDNDQLMQPGSDTKRTFPTEGREPQGKPPYEMAVSFQME